MKRMNFAVIFTLARNSVVVLEVGNDNQNDKVQEGHEGGTSTRNSALLIFHSFINETAFLLDVSCIVERAESPQITRGSIGINGELCASGDSSTQHPTWCISPNLHPVAAKTEPENKDSIATYNLTIDIFEYNALEKSASIGTLWIWCGLYASNTTF